MALTKQATDYMKAVYIEEFGDSSKLRFADRPMPRANPDEVLIQVEYSGVNPVDWKIEEGMFKNFLPYEFPIILGWEAAGTIKGVGDNVKNFKVGDQVYTYCRKQTVKDGSFAEYLVVDGKHVALKPKNLSFAQAASIPLCALTAWQAIHEAIKPKKGDKILILGGAGGVGSFAIQIARDAGCYIYTTASPKNHDYVRKLGVDAPIDYNKNNVVDAVKAKEPNGVDAILDLVGGQTLKNTIPAVKKNGIVVSIVDRNRPSTITNAETKFVNVFVRPDGQQLKNLTEQFNKGTLVAPEIEELPLSQTAKALEKIKTQHTRGKIVLRVK